MHLIRCTAKLQKEMGLKKADLSLADDQPGLLGQWHANIIFIDRKKCVLFVNDKTLTNFLAPDLPRAEIRNLDRIFYGLLGSVLSAEGYSEKEVEFICSEYKEIEYAATNSRKVLGHITDLSFLYEVNINSAGGVHSPEIPEIIKRMNHVPMNASKNCTWPDEELRKLVDSAK